MKPKALISLAITAKLICVSVFAYAKSQFSHDEAQLILIIHFDEFPFHSQKTQYGNTIRELELAIKGRDNKLRLVSRKNQEVEMEVQDLMDKITDW